MRLEEIKNKIEALEKQIGEFNKELFTLKQEYKEALFTQAKDRRDYENMKTVDVLSEKLWIDYQIKYLQNDKLADESKPHDHAERVIVLSKELIKINQELKKRGVEI